ncbi:hypothetical protein BD626DRAFT_450537 [Schizophyllum amplum]|uniref:non-specific serine/threonine protein kinase n=1 Tax=Schizophyllum amplum TaxID=97359 RepID=A0A550CTS3_9AGAR|nr:hypothetical protein BD626DRAFT_450537 [Auriculariopsis ampla]
MFGARTKQVNTYGKRSQRIVTVSGSSDLRPARKTPSIFDDIPPPQWAPVASRMKKRENPRPGGASPKTVHVKRNKPAAVPKKRADVKVADKMRLAGKTTVDKLKAASTREAPRSPLASVPINSPAGRARRSRISAAKGRPTGLPNRSPVVNVEIITLDQDGTPLKQERRVSHPRASYAIPSPQEEKPLQSLAACLKVAEVQDSDDEDDFVPLPKTRRRRRIVSGVPSVIEIESDPEPEPEMPEVVEQLDSPAVSRPLQHYSTPAAASIVSFASSPSPTPSPVSSPAAVLAPMRSFATQLTSKPRPLTPIRGHRRKGLFQPPSPPSPLTSSDFDDISFTSEDALGEDSPLSSVDDTPPSFPEFVRPLLVECDQEDSGPYEFSAFLNTFPYDPVVGATRGRAAFRKIGEASYSEVFGIGDVVLKIIPLKDDEEASSLSTGKLKARQEKDEDDEGPPPSDVKDVVKEVIVTRAMGEVCDRFVRLLKAYVVRGRYPEHLLSLWDEYNDVKGSESVRPDTFNVSQLYAIIILPNGGPDLEAYQFTTPSRTGWRQACSIFWQVAKALGHAEQLVSFEHRDLHWGQVLVQNNAASKTPLAPRSQNTRPAVSSAKVMMDDPVHGIHATLIDLGLSRMDAGDVQGGERIHWTPFDSEVFDGEGEYQYEVYRLMRLVHTGRVWSDFKPLTNVMWLHYLVLQLLTKKGLKEPSRRTPTSASSQAAFSEFECYKSLVDIEEWLGRCIAEVVASTKKRPARKSMAAKKVAASTKKAVGVLESVSPACAGEVVTYGVKKGWIRSVGVGE